MFKALTIAGSDSCGGAGIQADIKTMTVHKVYSACAITALTSQNTTGVKQIMEVTEEFLKSQLDAVFTDIRPDAVKCGMIPNAKLIAVVAESLKAYEATNVVVDPVMVATSGSKLMADSALETLKTKLLPLASLVTPNIPEASVLAKMAIQTREDMAIAGRKLCDTYHTAFLIKGGHGIYDASDLLVTEAGETWLEGKRIDNPNTHGTGCTLSSAIASNLAKGMELFDAVSKAKEYLTGAIADGLDLGQGPGPLNHMYLL